MSTCYIVRLDLVQGFGAIGVLMGFFGLALWCCALRLVTLKAKREPAIPSTSECISKGTSLIKLVEQMGKKIDKLEASPYARAQWRSTVPSEAIEKERLQDWIAAAEKKERELTMDRIIKIIEAEKNETK